MQSRVTSLELARRWAARPAYRWPFFAGLALAALWTALGQVGGLNDFRDSHLLHSYEDVAVRTMLEYGQFPFWDPWSCGGLYASGNPQTRFTSPTLLVSMLFGARRAEGVLAFLFLFLGMEGSYRYLKLRTGSALGPMLVAPVFGLNGFFAVTWALGWAYFFGFALLPWILLGVAWWVRGRRAGLFLTVAGFSVLIGFGGTYAVPLTGLFAIAEACRALYRLKGDGARSAALWRLGTAGLLIVSACVFRLWPILETMHSSPRVMGGAPQNGAQKLAELLFVLPGHGAGQFFIGPAIVVLALSAFFARKALFPTALVIISSWLAFGYTSPSLFALLREIPIFNLLRYPERFLLPGCLFIAELGALGLNALLVLSRKKAGAKLATLALITVALAGAFYQAYAFNIEPRTVTLVPREDTLRQPFAQARGNRWSQGFFLELNRGSLACGEGYPVRMSPALRGDLPAEEFLADSSLGSARRVAWSPNRIEVAVAASAPTELVINQNWHPGWTADRGEVVSHDGLLAVKLAPGEQRVVLRFLPRSAIAGGIVSALALAIAAWIWRRGRTQRTKPWQTLALGAAPLAVFGLLAATWREPVPAPVPTNADGSSILLDALPADATKVAGHFDLPLALEAVALTPPDPDGFVTAELFWRVTGPIPRSVGIFAHFHGPQGKFRSADHEVIGGTYFLKKAPRGSLLRDSFAVHLNPGEDLGLWKLRVGLWHASGDGTRVPAFDGSGKRIKQDQLEVARFTFAAPDAGAAPEAAE